MKKLFWVFFTPVLEFWDKIAAPVPRYEQNLWDMFGSPISRFFQGLWMWLWRGLLFLSLIPFIIPFGIMFLCTYMCLRTTFDADEIGVKADELAQRNQGGATDV